VSDATARLIDEEVRRLVEEGEGVARELLTEHIDDLHVLAKGLLEYETLSSDEVRALLRGEPIRTTSETPPPSKPRSSVPNTGAPSRDEPGPSGLAPEPQPGA
jgi:cell division protease FtsH